MINLLYKWSTHPAKWYQFWYPMSGISGGLVFIGILWMIVGILFIIWGVTR